ncbi:MAG: fused MFS/spermidine synthase [Vicinamibacterales bacterium]
MNQARLIRVAVAASLFINAFLVFILQPHISKRLLPVLGGSAEVWIVCSLFFQVSLLGGYAAAYAARRLPFSIALALHIALLAVAWLLWPFSAGEGPPPGAAPTWWTLRTLSGQVGLLLIALTATSPLLQYAYARALPSLDPYPLFTASNAGSLAGLFAYPLIVEPLLTLDQQAHAWTSGAVVLMLILAATASALVFVSGRAVISPLAAGPAITMRQRLRWIVLSLVPSVLLLSVTAQITTDIASVPLLWIVPLAVYLGSFIRVFAAGWQPWRWTWPIMAVLSLLMLMSFVSEPRQLWWIGVHVTILWCGSVICHGALVQERPSPARLPEFYLLMATGGARGGCLAGIVAPLVFTVRAEYPLAVVAALWLAPSTLGFRTSIRFTWQLAVGLAAIGVPTVLLMWTSTGPGLARMVPLLLAATAAAMWHRPRVFATLTTLALLAIVVERQVNPSGVVLRGRSFYGMYSVRDLPASQTRALFHGNTLHGSQSLLPDHRRDPLSYYGPKSPLADIFRARIGHTERVAVLGLGAGVILRYAQPGSSWTIYEIDPAIARLAQNPALFSHWADAAGSAVLVVGDGRLRLREAADASYDLIVADAFASDSVPVHLLTREAMALYLSKLRDGGAILFNISNRYLDLAPAIGATAARLGLVAFQSADDTWNEVSGLFSSRWVVVGRSTLAPPTERWTLITASPDDQGWTDDHSNVLAALRLVIRTREKISAVFRY